jgi:DNA processing protein
MATPACILTDVAAALAQYGPHNNTEVRESEMVCEQARADWRDWLGLLLTPGLGPRQAWQSLQQQPTPQAWAQPGPDWPAQCAATQAWLERDTNHFVVTLHDADYPQALRDLADPPLLLFGAGQRALLQAPRALAMVGSRNPTPLGQRTAHDLARELAEQGVVVASGLARGIDSAAHRGALDAGGPSVAFVGAGVDRVYPRAHAELAQRLMTHGLLLSELPLGSAALRHHFPRRNRLLAAWTQGTLVVEAALGSGSLITAHVALDLGREVMAMPGSIHAPQAKGCHALIKQGAALIEGTQDIGHAMGWLTPSPSAGPAVASPQGDAAKVWAHLLDAPQHIDTLSQLSDLAPATLQAVLLDLELDGRVASLPGGQWQRLA